MGEETKNKKVLLSAPPPAHSLLLYFFFVGLFTYWLPSWETLDQLATVETFTRVSEHFPLLPPQSSGAVAVLAYIRLFYAALIGCTTLEYYSTNTETEIMTVYLPGSQLHPTTIKLRGVLTLYPFTSMAWNMLGLSFTLSGYIAWVVAQQQQDDDVDVVVQVSPILLRAALICWTIAAPYTLLVSAIVRYVIWPMVLKDGGTTENFRTYRMYLMHNANCIMALSELALLGGLPVRWELMSFTCFFGLAYILFMWNVNDAYGIDVSKHGVQFLYFFCDTTMPGFFPSGAVLALLGVLSVFYALFVSAETLLHALPDSLVTNVLFVAGVSSLVMRFRD